MNVENEALKSATKRIKKDKESARTKNVVIVCASAILCTLIVCLTVLGVYTIKTQHDIIIEQQYALNMQFAGLLDWLESSEIEKTVTTTTNEANETKNADASDGGIAIIGDSNNVAGGDIIGQSDSQ